MTIAFVPAKSKSTRVINKNFVDLGGQPLIEWTLRACENWEYITKIVVATDNLDIKKYLGNRADIYDLQVLDSEDNRTVANLWKDFVAKNKEEKHVLLQCTNPFRTLREMEITASIYEKGEHDIVIAVKGIQHCILDENGNLSKDDIRGRMTLITQHRTPKYELNGSCCISNKDYINSCSFYEEGKVFPFKLKSMSSLEIDTEDDLKLCRAIADPIGFDNWWKIYGLS